MIRSFTDTFDHDVETVFEYIVFLKDSYDWVPMDLRVKNNLIVENGLPIRSEIETIRGGKMFMTYLFSEYIYLKEVRIVEEKVLDKEGNDLRKGSLWPYVYSAIKINFEPTENSTTLVKYSVFIKPKSVFEWLECFYDIFKCIKNDTLRTNEALKNHLSQI